MARPAVFLDRDGVLIEDVVLLTKRDQVHLYPGVALALRKLHEAGFALVVVSNQTVVARGLATEEDVEQINGYIQRLLYESSRVRIERFYFCPHHPNATLPQYRVNCKCRKPRSGMLLQAAGDLDLDLAASYMVGDRISDVIAGRNAGCMTLLAETGMHSAAPIESDAIDTSVVPDAVCANLAEAAEMILEMSR